MILNSPDGCHETEPSDLTPEFVAAWWNQASELEREAFLGLLGKAAYPVSESTWYVHPELRHDPA